MFLKITIIITIFNTTPVGKCVVEVILFYIEYYLDKLKFAILIYIYIYSIYYICCTYFSWLAKMLISRGMYEK